MSEILCDPWLDDACKTVESRTLEGLTNKTMRHLMMREAALRGRDGAMHYNHDNLVGFVHGLVDSLMLLGVKPELLAFGEVPYESWFFGKKRWDYLLEDPSRRPVMRIEMKCMAVCPRSDLARISSDMPAVLGTLYDHKVSGQSCFTGLVIAHRVQSQGRSNRRPRWTARARENRILKIGTFVRRLRESRLVDEVLYFEECGGRFTQPLPEATTRTFLSAVREEVTRHGDVTAPNVLEAWRRAAEQPLIMKRAPRSRSAL